MLHELTRRIFDIPSHNANLKTEDIIIRKYLEEKAVSIKANLPTHENGYEKIRSILGLSEEDKKIEQLIDGPHVPWTSVVDKLNETITAVNDLRKKEE